MIIGDDFYNSTKPLSHYLKPLLKEKIVADFLRSLLGNETENAIQDLLQEKYDNKGGIAYDLIMDIILNNSDCVHTCSAEGSAAGKFPVFILQLGPVFWVQAPDFDDVGFFSTKKDAIDFIKAEWQPYSVNCNG